MRGKKEKNMKGAKYKCDKCGFETDDKEEMEEHKKLHM